MKFSMKILRLLDDNTREYSQDIISIPVYGIENFDIFAGDTIWYIVVSSEISGNFRGIFPEK